MKTKKAFYLAILFTIGLFTINSCNKDDDCTEQTWYQDADNDGFGDPNSTQQSCTQPTGYVTDNTDCDDNDATTYPNATEICDGIDNNCDGTVDEGFDIDNDGYSTCQGDCDDANLSINPGATENTSDGIDNDCDGFIDETSICGNGIIEDGEECDDGNVASGDGCFNCLIE